MTKEVNLVAGIDVGAATVKTVILRNGEILAYSIIPTGHVVKKAITKATREALKKAKLAVSDLHYIISTGYGRDAVDFADETKTEILCHAKGANFLLPATRAVIDIGGQDSKAIDINEDGNVIDFVMNDKCAAGTGRFLEVMARALDMELEELGPVSLISKNPCKISSTCTVFAETEMVSLRAEGRERADLVAGIHKSVASRVATMASGLELNKEIVFTGGVAKNIGVKRALEEKIGIEMLVPEEPQIVGALGAALLAQAKLKIHDVLPHS